ncbi:unnamed protein product [Chondrus crispus]|uniref:Uncharacterized protein n=1 Tax=Chondrus crispus TaxID=2769 RepID=R7QEM9_CHOCR|nr:unnamed protein product [Chondrus crispus]CDF36962.1 unnamed protein product [Chondrus crispus]|eukprot:XP_005716781.1 unnamed protein product [Chondrus crispus]
MLGCKVLLCSASSFGGLDKFRDALNRCQSLADFIADVSGDLLQHADNLQKNEQNGEKGDHSGTVTVVIGDEDAKELSRKALLRKRCRLLWFNHQSGRKLRINVQEHPPCSTGKDVWCALCGNVKHNEDKWRGRRTGIKRGTCHVHLCTKTHTGQRVSCWNIWHNTMTLTPRATSPHKNRFGNSSRHSTTPDQSEARRPEIPSLNVESLPPSENENREATASARTSLRKRRRRT